MHDAAFLRHELDEELRQRRYQGLSIVLYLCFTEGLLNERIGLSSPLDAWRGFAMWLGADG
jgi:hypothetical protein